MSLQLIAPWGEITPVDIDSLGFKSVFGKRPTQVLLSSDNLTLVNNDYEQIKTLVQNFGRTENIPLLCVSESGFQSDYFLRHRNAVWTDSRITMDVLPRKGSITFFEKADNLTFEAIVAQGFLPEALSVKVPYLVVRDNTRSETLILIITGISITMEIIQLAKDIADLVADGANILAPQTAILKAGVLAIKIIALSIAIANVLIQLKEIYFPKLRYFQSCSLKTLIKQGCLSLGYQLESQLLDAIGDKYWVQSTPLQSNRQKPSFFEFLQNDLEQYTNNYYPSASDTVPLLGSLISEVEKIFNAETVVYNGTVRIEKRTTFFTNPLTSIPLVLNDQSNREMKWTHNDEDIWKRKVLKWETDFTDLHTADNFYKTVSEYSTEQINVVNADLEEIQGYQDVYFNFALGQRKNSLNSIEKLALGVFEIFDKLINLLGGNSNSSNIVNDRLGALIISEDTFSTTKLLNLKVVNNEGRQPPNFMNMFYPENIYNLYHTDLEIKNNSALIYNDVPIPMTDEQFHLFAQNKFVTIQETGQVAELLACTWLDRKAQAKVDIKLYDAWANNTKTIKIA